MKKLPLIFFFVIIMGVVSTNLSEAALNISVVPSDGGNNMRFGRVDLLSSVDKEVRIRVTSSEAEQYQVYQRLLGSFVNERGEMVRADVLSMSTLNGSNATGTLYGQNYEPVRYADQLLYTSGSSGASDGFTIFYRADPAALDASGQFTGKILYTVRTIGSPSQDEVVLQIYLDTGGALDISAQSSSAGNSVKLSDERSQDGEGYIQFSYHGNVLGTMDVAQEVLTWPRNESGKELDREALEVILSGALNGKLEFSSWQVLSPFSQKIYEGQGSEDTFSCQFRLNQEIVESQAAGTYRGRLRYIFLIGQNPKTLDFDLEVKIRPVFKIDVEYPQGGVHFTKLLPNSPPQVKEVVVTVKTNLGQPYIVNQNIVSPLTNEQGQQFESTYFTMKQEFVGSPGGELKFPKFEPVPYRLEPLYYSDQAGRGTVFRVLYRQKPYTGMNPGSYKTSVVYSLEEL